MGERGQPTRMLAAKYGGYLTFGALGGGKESAPGQPTLHQLRHMYRLPDLTPNCQVCDHSTTVSLQASQYFMLCVWAAFTRTKCTCIKTYPAARFQFTLLLRQLGTSKVAPKWKSFTPSTHPNTKLHKAKLHHLHATVKEGLKLLYAQIFGVIGNPVSHSRSPQLHNAAMAAAGIDAVYLPLLVDNLKKFLKTYSSADYGGFSVTIPHKVCCL